MEKNTNPLSSTTAMRNQLQALRELPGLLDRLERSLSALNELPSCSIRLEKNAKNASNSLSEIAELKSRLQAGLAELNTTLKSVASVLQDQTCRYLDLQGELEKQRQSQAERVQWHYLVMGLLGGALLMLPFQ